MASHWDWWLTTTYYCLPEFTIITIIYNYFFVYQHILRFTNNYYYVLLFLFTYTNPAGQIDPKGPPEIFYIYIYIYKTSLAHRQASQLASSAFHYKDAAPPACLVKPLIWHISCEDNGEWKMLPLRRYSNRDTRRRQYEYIPPRCRRPTEIVTM